MLVAKNFLSRQIFVATNIILLRQTSFCCDKGFIATNTKHVLLRQNICRNKKNLRRQTFFAASILLLRQKTCFVATNTCLSRQHMFVATKRLLREKVIVVAAPTSDITTLLSSKFRLQAVFLARQVWSFPLSVSKKETTRGQGVTTMLLGQ